LDGIACLQYKKASVENTGIDESSTKLATLEKFIWITQKHVVSVKHHHSVILHHAPDIKLIECVQEALIELWLRPVWVWNILHNFHFDTFIISVQAKPKQQTTESFSISTMKWNFSHHHQHIKKMSTNNPKGYHHLYSSTLGSLFLKHQLHNHTRKPLLTNVGGMAFRSMYTPEGGM
jgi:hypothetical protein